MHKAMNHAQRRGADWMSIEVDEPDTAARHLYESLGFTNHGAGPDGPVMFVYEREL
jgi:ribosomal protein S18 acetylase RimI-like enzyme